MVSLYGMLECNFCCEFILLLNMKIQIAFCVEGCRVSSAEYRVHLVESFVVFIMGKMTQDVGMV